MFYCKVDDINTLKVNTILHNKLNIWWEKQTWKIVTVNHATLTLRYKHKLFWHDLKVEKTKRYMFSLVFHTMNGKSLQFGEISSAGAILTNTVPSVDLAS